MKKSSIFFTILVSVLLLSIGYLCGVLSSNAIYVKDPEYASLRVAWDSIKKMYVDRENVDFTKLSNDACEAMLESIGDNHSVYFYPEDLKYDNENSYGTFYGIGASVILDENGEIVVSDVTEGSPAEKAGIRVGDIYVSVDGKSVDGLSSKDVSLLTRGEEGTDVTVRISRDGEEIDFTMTRSKINIKSVGYRMIDDILYMNIDEFRINLADDIEEALRFGGEQHAKGIIVDLTYNPGGYESALIKSAELFLNEGDKILTTQNFEKNTAYVAGKNKKQTDLPVVILVSRHSVSAAEAFTAALHDNGRAVVAGQQTYGKGTACRTITLPNGSAMYMTCGLWLTPNDVCLEDVGFTPDIKLDFDTDWVGWAVDKLHSMAE